MIKLDEKTTRGYEMRIICADCGWMKESGVGGSWRAGEQ